MSASSKKLVLTVILFVCCIVAIYALVLSAPDNSSKKTPAKPAPSTSQKAPSKQNQGSTAQKPAGSNPPAASSQTPMADTGPGDVVAVFACAVVFGYIAHRTYLMKRRV